MAESYPTYFAGQRITASLLRSGQEVVARKTADTSRAATTTTTADPHLQFEVEANAVYVLDGWIKYDSPTAADINVDWTAPSGALGEWTAIGVGSSPVIGSTSTPTLQTDTQDARGYMLRVETNDVAAARSFGGLGTGNTPITLHIKGTLRVGSTGGTYSLDWAQFTSNATATTIYSDSWLRLQRVA
ncbi:MAG TPA: hypothetical protein VNO54_28030 [Streptosporangiaceae bacterium]|nr:hypothetical protein [Streptosporangiaceae bacterium]